MQELCIKEVISQEDTRQEAASVEVVNSFDNLKETIRLGEASRKFKAADGEPTVTVDISDLVKPRK